MNKELKKEALKLIRNLIEYEDLSFGGAKTLGRIQEIIKETPTKKKTSNLSKDNSISNSISDDMNDDFEGHGGAPHPYSVGSPY